MAGMPNPVVLRANEIMKFLEKDHEKKETKERLKEVPPAQVQMTLFEGDKRFTELKEFLSAIDINTISPVEALLKLNEAKTILREKNSKSGK